MALNYSEDPHRRHNILTGEWILVSPHRMKRPWQGKIEDVVKGKRPSFDPACYLCPTNERAGGEVNPDYKSTYAFTNDFGALIPDTTNNSIQVGLLRAEGERGECRVICFSPDHSLTIADMELDQIVSVIKIWQHEYETLGSKSYINHVQIFENKGATMGCSNPHPHGQIWAQSSIPNEAQKKAVHQKLHWDEKGSSLLGDYLVQELSEDKRLIHVSEHFVALVPYWAIWPYEVMIAPKRHIHNIIQLSPDEVKDYAEIIKIVTTKYDKLFDTSFPYSSGIHQSPTDDEDHSHWHMHMVFYPPLLRSATVKKFMVGYEMFGSPQRDITAEKAASQLRVL